MSQYDLPERKNFKLILEYDGSHYHGWQRQLGVLTIQEVLESRLEIMLQSPVGVRASGRTDAGVHARGQVVNFHVHTRLRPDEILRGINSLLPPDIVVLHAEEAAESFHARFSATGKTYEYHILNRPIRSALQRRYAWHVPQPLEPQRMRECLGSLLGRHDFAAFMASGSKVKSTERTIRRADLDCLEDGGMRLIFEANGFLRHMVRNLVGTIVEVGRGVRAPEEFLDILSSRDRKRAGMTAPAHGLFLTAVHYTEDLSCNS